MTATTTIPTTVITASIWGRSLLADAVASVGAQTLPPVAHLIRVSERSLHHPARHIAEQRNALLAMVDTPWVSILDDDDVYFPEHFATIAPKLDEDPAADVVYSWGAGLFPRIDVTGWEKSHLIGNLEAGNLINTNSTIRTDLLRSVGGYSTEFDEETKRFSTGAEWEDWDLWLRLAHRGARFVCVPTETWEYRIHHGPRVTEEWT